MPGNLTGHKLIRRFPQDCVDGHMKRISVLILEPGHIGKVRFGIVHELENERLLVLIPFQPQLKEQSSSKY